MTAEQSPNDIARARVELAERVRADAGRLADAEASTSEAPFVSWMLEAARLAALGDVEPFTEWPRLATAAGVDLDAAMRRRALAGIEAIEKADGVELAEGVVSAEDAAFLVAIEAATTDLLGEGAGIAALRTWIDAAGEAVPDEEAIEAIVAHGRRWPVTPERRLPVVERPLGELDLVSGGVLSQPGARWRRVLPRSERVEELAVFDDGRPTPGMIDRFAARRGRADLRDGTSCEIDSELDPFWQVSVSVQPGERVRRVRLGAVVLAAHADQEGAASLDVEGTRTWFVGLSRHPLDVRIRLASSDLVVETDDGDRFLL